MSPVRRRRAVGATARGQNDARTRRSVCPNGRLPCVSRIDQLIEAELDLFYRSALASFATRDNEIYFRRNRPPRFELTTCRCSTRVAIEFEEATIQHDRPHTSIGLKFRCLVRTGIRGWLRLG